jgi:hypothetical protein
MAKNTHKVNKENWEEWGKEGQAAFNRLWGRLDPAILPAVVQMTQKEFNVLRWNVCWTVADMVRDYGEPA